MYFIVTHLMVFLLLFVTLVIHLMQFSLGTIIKALPIDYLGKSL